MHLGGGVSSDTPPMARRRKTPSLTDRLVHVACEFFGLSDEAILSSKLRPREVTLARWAIWHVLMTDAGWSSLRAAALFRKDHKAVLNGAKQVKHLLRTDALFFEAVDRLRREVAPL